MKSKDYTPEIKPCPICGVSSIGVDNRGGVVKLICNHCGGFIESTSPAVAVENWNSRILTGI